MDTTIPDTCSETPSVVTIRAASIPMDLFFPLLQRGVLVAAVVGRGVQDVLCGQLGIEEDYLENRVQTVFLDGKAVDDLVGSVVENGSEMALSSALPGLAGATLRRGGFYASLRSAISYDCTMPHSDVQSGLFTLKLYNLVLNELGPALLQRGICLTSREIVEIADALSKRLNPHDVTVTLDGKEMSPAALREWAEHTTQGVVPVRVVLQ
jgi:hypothetical protein